MTELTWAGGEHAFDLRLGELRALQDLTDAGPEQVLMRLRHGGWRVDDIVGTLRLGLQGGGMAKAEASDLVGRMVAQHRLIALKMTAMLVLQAALLGVEDDPVGEPEAEESPAAGASPPSTETPR